MRISAILLTLMLSSLTLTAQNPHSPTSDKLDGHLKKLIEQDDRPDEVTVFLRLKSPKYRISSNSYFSVNSRIGNLLTARVLIDSLPRVLSDYPVERIEFGGYQSAAFDSVRHHTNVHGVLKGWGPIDQAYTGKDVIIGIIDTGIDYEHNEFRDKSDNTKCRILSLWSQWDEEGTKPDSFSYGSEYFKQQFEDEINGVTQDALPITDYDPTKRGGQSHGTHVAGIAAGLNGMAPEADIIAVSVTWESAAIVDGIKYVIDKARILGRPCVINLSLGTLDNLHDGTGTIAEAYREVVNLRPEGTVICAAAGNSGRSNIHWGNFDLSSEPRATYFYGEPVRLVFAISDTLIDKISFSVTGFTGDFDYDKDTFSNLQQFGLTNWFTPKSTLAVDFEHYMRYGNGNVGGIVKAVCDSQYEGSRHHYFVIEIDDNADIDLRQRPRKANGIDLYRINVKGEGRFNSWLMPVSLIGSGSFSRSVTDPSAIGAPQISNFVAPGNEFSVIAPALFKETISVGASVNRWAYFDTDGKQHPARWARNPNGSLGTFTGQGPTVDGRIMPEIVAPGENVFCAAPSYYDGWGAKVYNGKYVNSSGTSMACPAMAGAVALYLEKYPKATLTEVRDDFLANTVEDEYTDDYGDLPNNRWGYGKLDIYKVISGGIFYGTSAIGNDQIAVYPNPVSANLNLDGNYQKIEVYSVQGQLLEVRNQGEVLSMASYPNGLYVLRVETPEGTFSARITVSH